MNNTIRIHCFEPTGIEGFPSNTYEANSIYIALDCIKGILENKNSGISRILIENPSFGESRCYNNISAVSPMGI